MFEIYKNSRLHIIIFGIAAMAILFCCSSQANAEQEGDYRYLITDDKAQISGYTGAGGKIKLPSTLGGIPVTSIGDHAFDNCTSITSVTIPQSITYIGRYVFQDCKGLTSVDIPVEVTNIDEGAFWGCTALKSITIPKNISIISSCIFGQCKKLTNITIPEGVTGIGSGAFLGCESLTSITIPESITSIDDAAFMYCMNLKSIIIPHGVTTINDQVFKECRSLTSISIPQGVTSIGYESFNICNNLTSITIPKGVTSVGKLAFWYCPNLNEVTFESPTTNIYDWNCVFPDRTKIIGYDPSTAKTWAAKYNRKFEVIKVTPKIILNGKTLNFDVPPIIDNDRVLVPLRAIFEAMNAKVNWDSKTMTIIAVKEDTTVILKIGTLTPTVNGSIEPIDVPGKIVNGRTMAPLRFVCEAFGGTLNWSTATQTATINSIK